MKKNSRRYFGTDGVRGRVGESPITPDFVMRLGYAAGKVLAAEQDPRHRSGRIAIFVEQDAPVGIARM